MTDAEKMVWSAALAVAIHDGNQLPALFASHAVDELRKASLGGLSFIDRTQEGRVAMERLQEMQRGIV